MSMVDLFLSMNVLDYNSFAGLMPAPNPLNIYYWQTLIDTRTGMPYPSLGAALIGESISKALKQSQSVNPSTAVAAAVVTQAVAIQSVITLTNPVINGGVGFWFTIASPPTNLFVSANVNVTVALVFDAGYSGTVTFSAKGYNSAGQVAYFTFTYTPTSKNSAGTWTWNIATDALTPTGTYYITVIGTDAATPPNSNSYTIVITV